MTSEPPAITRAMSAVPPLRVEHRQGNIRPTQFVPDTRLVVTPAFRTSGLLAALSDRDARTLLAVVTFLSSDGRFTGTARGIAAAIGVPERDVGSRLRSLMVLTFEGAPVLVEVPREQALPVYVPGPRLVRHVQEEPISEATASDPAPVSTVSREVLIARNRERYSRSRAEVEQIVAEQLGSSPLESEDSPQGETLRRLMAAGVFREDATRLIGSFPLEVIQQQLDWLPYREARLPARFLVAAIENNYDPPVEVMQQREQEPPLNP